MAATENESQKLSHRVQQSRNLSLIGGIIMIMFGVACIIFASSLLITHTKTGYFATILEGSFSIPAIALDYVIGILLVVAGVLAIVSSVMLANVKRRYVLSVSWVVFVSLCLLMAILR
ncbi:predicted protein [Naegleria gruberi]|uniref:Predicted protein n=1 Tax=Naegleria gruberi TaxID=5762 RepID=D2VN14_NAEGR|nr:uncharacterized protein NAEGRDRAFT_70336 [Naegleria gruberi]EFC41915.1 predicted protein [Naegleria gruberi]|eukprot:XP_002674659.1 predicted protein [Naegleria gruberi strain NEG-M]